MADKKNIRQQVEELTQEQQDTVIKVGKISLLLQILGDIPFTVMAFLNWWKMVNPPADISYSEYDKLFMNTLMWAGLGVVYVVALLIFVKVKYPFYSDAKWKYIHKMRKIQK